MEQDTYIRRGTGLYVRANLALFIAGFVTFSTLYTFQPPFPILVAPLLMVAVIQMLRIFEDRAWREKDV